MTTIPIEVIVQDAEAPIVPGEDGANTNTNAEATVAVPDTGAISSSGDTSFSASSIILPAILLVLAIGSIVAILIHKYHKQKKDKSSKKEKLAVATSSTIAVLVATVLVSNLILPATKAATSDIEDGITPAEDKVSIVVTRDGSSVEESIESTATITSTSDFGYKVLLSMAEGVETANLYLDGDETSEYYIASVESEEGTELAENTWGFALTEDGEYSAIPLVDNAAVVVQGNEPVEDAEMSIYYGVRVSSDLPAGTYSGGEIEYTLQPSTGFPDSLVYMQDMTSEICAAAPTPGNSVTDPVPTTTLEDIRDHNTYTIAKLADGKCWMTQNLDLDLEKDGTITYDSTNTNLTVAGSGAYENGYTTQDGIITWTPANATIGFTGDAVEGWENSDTTPYSANPGNVYYYTSGSDADDIPYNSLAECVEANHTAEDCEHYHAGNYYNWSAAIASNDSSSLTTQYDNAANSICPAGWRLPANIANDEDTMKKSEQVSMVIDYEDVLDDDYHEVCLGGCDYYYGYTGDGFSFVRTMPFYLTRSGLIYYGNFTGYKSAGYYKSSSPKNSFSSLQIDSNGIGLARYHNRAYGESVRCVAE